jgi:hypothetical protein
MVLEVVGDDFGKLINFIFRADTNEFGFLGMCFHMSILGENNLHGGVHLILFNISDETSIEEGLNKVSFSSMAQVGGEPEQVDAWKAG